MIASHRAIAPVLGCIMLAASVLLAAAAGARVPVLVPRGPHALVGSIAFLIGVVSLAECLGMRVVDARDWWLGLVLASSCLVIWLVARSGAFDLERATLEGLLVVSTAAWVEESTFRLILPRAFARALSAAGEMTARLSAVVASQALFVASHFLPGTVRSGWPDITPTLRLFVGGLLLWMIASRVGLMGAVVTHALLNLGAAFGDASPSHHPTRAGMLIVGVLALAALLSESNSPTRKPFTQRNPV